MKLPACVLVIVRSGNAAGSMIVESIAVLLLALLSVAAVVTVMLLTFGDVAFDATLTVTVSAG